MDNLTIEISRLLEHLKIKPTYVVLNTIYVTLKNYGYRDIPRIHFSETIDKKVIVDYCSEIEEIIQTEPDSEEKKKSSSKEIHMFQESSMLPQNVYVSEKGDEEKLEDNYIEEDVTSASESENSAGSEIEEQEEGYDVYEENEDEEFSD
jgi:hypothetical protein